MEETNMKKTYGYVRVSSREQNEERQVVAMQEFGVPDNCMVIEKQSGKDFNRPGYKKLIKKMKPELFSLHASKIRNLPFTNCNCR